MAGERKRCIDAGANDYVPKPVDQAELFAALRPWLPPAHDQRAALAPSRTINRRSRRASPQRSGLPRTRPWPPAAIEASTLDGLKILVVDDDFRNIFAMTALLERGHADRVVAESGAEAIATLERTPDIDIVLMDIMMPVMDGYDTIRAIRRIDRFEVLPIVAVTGKAAAGERQRCIDAGADDYIPKPVDTGELLVEPHAVAADASGVGPRMSLASSSRRARSRRAHGDLTLGGPHPRGRRQRRRSGWR